MRASLSVVINHAVVSHLSNIHPVVTSAKHFDCRFLRLRANMDHGGKGGYHFFNRVANSCIIATEAELPIQEAPAAIIARA